MRTTTILSAAVIGVSGMLLISPPSNAAAPLPAGTGITVFLDTSGNLPEPDPAGPPNDMLIFTGGRTFSSSLDGCTDQPVTLQNTVLVDSGGSRASRLVFAFVQRDAVPAGTRLTNLTASISCTSNGIEYRKYQGTVE